MPAPGAGKAGTSACSLLRRRQSRHLRFRRLRRAYAGWTLRLRLRLRPNASPLRNHLALDPPGVLLVLERRQVELDDALLPVERVPTPDRDVRAGHLDHVVTGSRRTPETQARHRAGAD